MSPTFGLEIISNLLVEAVGICYHYFMDKNVVPKELQGILWSVDVSDLDLRENKSYIVNQILSLGTLEELSWLFKTYTKGIAKRVFVNEPAKIYSPSSFNFCKNVLLDLEDKDLPLEKYLRDLPRRIPHRG